MLFKPGLKSCSGVPAFWQRVTGVSRSKFTHPYCISQLHCHLVKGVILSNRRVDEIIKNASASFLLDVNDSYGLIPLLYRQEMRKEYGQDQRAY